MEGTGMQETGDMQGTDGMDETAVWTAWRNPRT